MDTIQTTSLHQLGTILHHLPRIPRISRPVLSSRQGVPEGYNLAVAVVQAFLTLGLGLSSTNTIVSRLDRTFRTWAADTEIHQLSSAGDTQLLLFICRSAFTVQVSYIKSIQNLQFHAAHDQAA